MLDRDGNDAFAPGGDLSPEGRKEACQKLCGLGIAFKPDKRGNLFVKRLVPGGPADASKLIEVSGAGGAGLREAQPPRVRSLRPLSRAPTAPTLRAPRACRTRALCVFQPAGMYVRALANPHVLQAGDVLHAVDGKNVIGMNKMEVASLLM